MLRTTLRFICVAVALFTGHLFGASALAHEDLTMQHPHDAYGGHIPIPQDSAPLVPGHVEVHVRCWTNCYSDGLSRNHRDYMALIPSERGYDLYAPRRVVTEQYNRDSGEAYPGYSQRRRGRWDGVARVGFLAGGAALGDEIHGKGVAGEVFGALLGNALFDAIR